LGRNPIPGRQPEVHRRDSQWPLNVDSRRSIALDESSLRVDSGHLAADKIMRLHAQTATIENGFVHLPDEARWLADTLAELTTFPASRHDDQVASTA
jgi:phage terminase large subunit-like protein